MLFPPTCLRRGWAEGVRFSPGTVVLWDRGSSGQECEAPGAPPAQPVTMLLFTPVRMQPCASPRERRSRAFPHGRAHSGALFSPVLCLNPAVWVNTTPPPAAPGAWPGSVAETYMPARAFCLVADSWQVVCGREPLHDRNFPGERAPSAPLTLHQFYPVTLRACYLFCLPTCPEHSAFILEKSDSALEIRLRSHLLQEVGPECLPLTCVKCLVSDVPGLALVCLFVSH